MNLAARLTLAEAAVARLAARKGPRVSDLMRRARARAMAGGPAPSAPLYDIVELERDAARPGLLGRIARARLRVLQDPAPIAPPARQNTIGGMRGDPPAPGEAARSARLQNAVAGTPASKLAERINRLLTSRHG